MGIFLKDDQEAMAANPNPYGISQQGQQPFNYAPAGIQDFANSANVFLQRYGMQEPTPNQINPYLFFGNSGYLGQHPGLARGIDAGLSGLAFTAPSRTIGEGLSNVAQGIMGARQAHIQNIVGQYQRPLQMAGELQGLQHGANQLDLMNAQAQEARQRGAYFADRNETMNNKIGATRPYTGADGRTWTYDTDQSKWVAGDVPAGFIPKNLQGKTTPERVALLEEQDDVNNGKPQWTPKQKANRITQLTSQMAGQRAGATKSADVSVDLANGGMTDVERTQYNTDAEFFRSNLIKIGDDPFKARMAAKQAGVPSSTAGQSPSIADIRKYNQGLKDEFDTKWNPVLNRGKSAAPPSKPSKPSAVSPTAAKPVQTGRLAPDQMKSLIDGIINGGQKK